MSNVSRAEVEARRSLANDSQFLLVSDPPGRHVALWIRRKSASERVGVGLRKVLERESDGVRSSRMFRRAETSKKTKDPKKKMAQIIAPHPPTHARFVEFPSVFYLFVYERLTRHYSSLSHPTQSVQRRCGGPWTRTQPTRTCRITGCLVGRDSSPAQQSPAPATSSSAARMVRSPRQIHRSGTHFYAPSSTRSAAPTPRTGRKASVTVR